MLTHDEFSMNLDIENFKSKRDHNQYDSMNKSKFMRQLYLFIYVYIS